ncbi:hypothetical protein KFK09_016536 [Dendrobium nobile]|uniref:Uncharacterized protein n=1 Tax=Dendrobium nobile TaxID=94219 RepID=A0A8T3AZS5_DENNO|nr:hypothetical protein KFK09_016536 [Dendrobium nobile]
MLLAEETDRVVVLWLFFKNSGYHVFCKIWTKGVIVRYYFRFLGLFLYRFFVWHM